MGKEDQRQSVKGNKWATILQLTSLGLGLFCVKEIGSMDNILEERWLFIIFAFAGIILAFFIHKILKYQFPQFVSNPKFSRASLIICLVLGLGFGLPATASLINRKYPIGSSECKPYKILSKDTSAGKKTRFIFVEINHSSERIKCSREKWNSISNQSSLILCIKKGRLGFDFIDF